MVHTERLYVCSCMHLDGLCLCVVCGGHMCIHGVDM